MHLKLENLLGDVIRSQLVSTRMERSKGYILVVEGKEAMRQLVLDRKYSGLKIMRQSAVTLRIRKRVRVSFTFLPRR